MVTVTEKPKNGRRGRRILLIASLALNVVVVCVAIGAFVGIRNHDGPSMEAGRFSAVYVRALEHEDRRAIGKHIRKAYRADRSDRQADRDRVVQMVAVLKADPLDATALRNVRQALDESAQRRRMVAFDVWLGYVEKMTNEQRTAYADRMQNVLEHRGHSHKRDKYKRSDD